MQNEDGQDSIDLFIEKCKQHNLKITPQRIAIYREIIKSKKHSSADNIFQIIRKEYPNISFDTVNRTLVTFSEIGIVEIVESFGGARRFDPILDNHHHLHCISCGEIIDFYHDEYDSLVVPVEIQKQYTVLNKRVVLNVICDKCKKQKSR